MPLGGALLELLGIDDLELVTIFTVQTAGVVLNYHSHLNRPLADSYWKAGGYWKDRVCTKFSEVDLDAITQAFGERVLAQRHKLELLTDDDVVQSCLKITQALGSLSRRSLD